MSSPRLRDPLRRRVFRRLAFSYAINELGDWMGIVALSVLVFDQTESAMATALLWVGTGFLPAILAPLLVARAEQPPPRYVLPVLYCGEAATFGALALAAANFSLPAVVALATLDRALAVSARALTRAVVAAMLEPHGELRAGNSILNIGFTGGAAVGPGIAGLVVAGFGVQSALLLDAASFYAIAWIIFTAGHLPQAEPDPGHMRERLRAGLSYIREQIALRRLIIAEATALIFFAAVIPIEVIYAKETLGVGDSGYGLLLASWGAGMVLGSIAFAALRGTRLGLLLLFSTIGIAAGYLGMAAAPELAAACVGAAVGGLGNGVWWVAMVSAVQELTAASMQARVMSVVESLGSAMPGVGYLAGGVVASIAEPRATFLFAGLGVLGLLAVATPLLATRLPGRTGVFAGNTANEDEVMVELIPVVEPGSIQSDREVTP
jgi:MFS family permease